MIARLPRPAALILALLLGLVVVWCLTTTPLPLQAEDHGGYTDVRLYRDIADAVARGQPYYRASAAIQRAHHYPLRPFVTVRPPTLAWWAATVGWRGVQITAIVLALAGLVGWVAATAGVLRPIERLGVALALVVGSGPMVNPAVVALHECLAGLCLSLALAGVWGWPRRWGWTMAPLVPGLAVRELVVPFGLLAMVFAMAERRWRELAAWLVLLGVWLVLMAWHAHQVARQWQSGDGVSQGWIAMQGPTGFLSAVIHTSVLSVLPLHGALLAACLPMLGWLAVDGRTGRFSALLVAGYATLLACFSRPDTFYWGSLLLPWYFVGYALVPRALWQLVGAISGVPVRAPAVRA